MTASVNDLDRDPEDAQGKLNKLLQDKRRGNAGLREWLDVSFSDLADLFWDDMKARKSPATYGGAMSSMCYLP